jgi:hypothetical protein
MLRMRVIGLAFVAVFALSAVSMSSASAFTTFKAKPTGGKFPAKIIGTGGVQEFASGSATITCEKALASGEAKAESETVTLQLVHYEGNCKAKEGILSSAVTEPILADYLIHASGLVDIDEPIVIHVTLGGCTITVLKQAGLHELTFDNNAAKTEITALANPVKEVLSEGSGGICGTAGVVKKGTYKGTVTSKLEAGGELFVE